jgi:hypothetical protein
VASSTTKKSTSARRAVHQYSRDANRLTVVGWFDEASIEQSWPAKFEEPSYSTRLLRLESGKWIEERTYNHMARRVAYKVTAREAALWLIKHGHGDVADELLSSEVEATRL